MEVFGNMKKRVVDLEEVSSFHQGTPGIDLENYFKQLKHLMEKQIKIWWEVNILELYIKERRT